MEIVGLESFLEWFLSTQNYDSCSNIVIIKQNKTLISKLHVKLLFVSWLNSFFADIRPLQLMSLQSVVFLRKGRIKDVKKKS